MRSDWLSSLWKGFALGSWLYMAITAICTELYQIVSKFETFLELDYFCMTYVVKLQGVFLFVFKKKISYHTCINATTQTHSAVFTTTGGVFSKFPSAHCRACKHLCLECRKCLIQSGSCSSLEVTLNQQTADNKQGN